MKKRGQSEIIAIVLIIVLVLVAIALLWGPVQNLIRGNLPGKQADCMKVDLEVSSAVYNTNPDTDTDGAGADIDTDGPANLTVVVSRLDGETIVMKGSRLYINGVAQTTDSAGIGALGSLTITNNALAGVVPTKVKVATILDDGKGANLLCTNTAERNIA